MGDDEYKGNERRKGLYIEFDLIKYLETDYIIKIKQALALPCKEREERIKGIESKIIWLWSILGSGVFLGILAVVIRNIFQ